MSHFRKKRNDVLSAMLGVSQKQIVVRRIQYLDISQEADLVPLHHQRNLADSSNSITQLVPFLHICLSPNTGQNVVTAECSCSASNN